MALPAGTKLGPYEIVAALGTGGMGEVYKAHDRRLDRVVALKILRAEYAGDPDYRARLVREARTIASLSHPHICALFDVGTHGEIDFLVMEYLDGETLSARLARSRPPAPSGRRTAMAAQSFQQGLTLTEALRFATDIADALAAAHKAGVVHRDLKPGNIILTRGTSSRSGTFQAKVLDFGIARRTSKAQPSNDSATRTLDQLTTSRSLVGTIPYMAPEQLEGGPIDARSDLFAFGAVVYEMVTGRRAFEAQSQASLIAAILDRDPAPISALQPRAPRGLDRLVRKCLAKDPDARWQSAADVADELRWLIGSLESSVRSQRLAPLERPNLGRLVAGLCDRRVQEEEFRDRFLEALDAFPGTPQAFFIHGDEGQCHETLVQRFIDRVDRSIGSAAAGRSGGRVKKIAWQHDGQLAQRCSRQIYSLFEQFSLQVQHPVHVRDRSAGAFAALLAKSLSAYVAIEHEVHANRWDAISEDSLNAYLRFWAELPPSDECPLIVVFFNVIFPRAGVSKWKRLAAILDGSAGRRRRIQHVLRVVEGNAEIPCRVLAELPSVTREDLLEWFSLNHIYESEQRRIRAVDRLFPDGTKHSRAMCEIEAFCAEELRHYLADHAYAAEG